MTSHSPSPTTALVGELSPPTSPKMEPSPPSIDEKPQTDYLDASVIERETNNRSTQIPTPPQSLHSQHHSDEENVSEDPSPNSPQPQRQRRHARGGRKPKQQRHAQRLQSVSEIEIPRSHARPEEDEQDFIDEESEEEASLSPLLAPPDARSGESDYDAEALSKARGTRKQVKKIPPRPPAKPTGVSAFSIQRPRGGGRKPPIAVNVERPGEEPKTRPRTKGGKGGRKTKAEEEDIAEDESDEGEQEPEQSRPVKIRLDLNLELDILFKAKIKGDVTITFL